MRKSLWAILLLLGICLQINAQYKIYGNVYDELGDSVSFASVTLVDALTQKTVTFKNTNSKGDYELKVKEPGSYIIKVKNIKYQNFEEEIVVTEDQKEYKKDINIFSKSGELETIIAKGKKSVAKISGDTITFKIENFTDQTEQNLGDIINKLPGMEVDEGGNIKANGKKVDKLLVEGEEFFSDSQKMATQNLNAKAVKDIQLLTDYKEKGKLSEMDAQKKTAVNVQLNEEYKKKITGDAMLGSGYESKYDFHTNLFKFNKRGNFAFIGDLQNTGDQVLSFTDYMGFVGGLSEVMSSSRGNAFTIRAGSLGNLLSSSNRVEKRINQMGALNVNQSLNENWKIKLTSNFSNERANSFSQQLRDYYNGLNENVLNRDKNDVLFNNNSLKLEYKPNDSVLLSYRASVNFSSNIGRNHVDNILNGNAQYFDDNEDAHPYNINQKLTYEFKPSKHLLMSFGGNYVYDYQPKANTVLSQNPYLGLPQDANNQYNTTYNYNQKTKNALLYGNVKYSKKKLIYNFEVGAKSTESDIISNWIDNQYKSELFAENYSYKYALKNQELYSELSLAKNKDFWQFELGTLLKYYTMKDRIQPNFNRFMAYPFANISANFSTSSALTFDYEYRENFPEVRNYLPSDYYIIDSYRNITLGNLGIDNALYFPNHSFSLNYRIFNQFSGFYLSPSISYNLIDGSIASKTNIGTQYNEIYNLVAPKNQRYSGRLYGGNKFKLGIPWQVRLNGNYSYTDGYSYVNDFYSSTSRNYNTGVSLSTQMEPKFNVEVGLNYGENKTKIESDFAPEQFFINRSYYVELRGAYKDTGIKWESRLTRNSNSSKINLNIWDLDFTYQRPKSPWEFGIVGRNLLNFNNKEQVNVGNNNLYLYQNTYRILPGYFMLTAKLKF